jgi:hypothetical protein
MRSSGWWYRAYMDSMGIDGTAGHMRCASYTFACSSELAVVLKIPVNGVLAYD